MPAATRLVLQNAESLIKEGRFTQLLEWINTMADEVGRQHSVLATRKGIRIPNAILAPVSPEQNPRNTLGRPQRNSLVALGTAIGGGLTTCRR